MSASRDCAAYSKVRSLRIEHKKELNARYISLKFHNIECSVLESAMGRGDRRLGKVIESAWKNGAKFDLWDECFQFDVWQKAFADNGLDLDACAQQAFTPGQALPWSHLGGPKENYLLDHWNSITSQ